MLGVHGNGLSQFLSLFLVLSYIYMLLTIIPSPIPVHIHPPYSPSNHDAPNSHLHRHRDLLPGRFRTRLRMDSPRARHETLRGMERHLRRTSRSESQGPELSGRIPGDADSGTWADGGEDIGGPVRWGAVGWWVDG